jgi:hypothetical protein
MLLGLTILLVLLAWTLGNTITQSTNRSSLVTHFGRSLHKLSVSRPVRNLSSSLKRCMSSVNEVLSRIELQPALATLSPMGDIFAGQVVTTGHSSDCCALLIGRTSVGPNRHRSLTARNAFSTYCLLMLRLRGTAG